MRAIGGGLVQIFTLFVPKALQMEAVPSSIREAALARTGGRNVKWYAAERSTGGFFTAVDYETDAPPGRFLRLSLWQEGEGGGEQKGGGEAEGARRTAGANEPKGGAREGRGGGNQAGRVAPEFEGSNRAPARLAEVTLPVRFELPFGCSARGAAAGPGGELIEGRAAGGWVWDVRAVAVAGTTADGEQVRTKPVNGCWLLVSTGPGQTGWRQFRALDERGRTLYGEEV